ncbi:3'(2'),5'-bisphosphate nucleotidase CysQ [Saccharopolyspora taberi]|uniref:3'(2'),5'-bisphosphate nucleotidase CysQ n=1 Tax=Saccharopolyspora taberi TaxID=60895 RepID=A0ABN3VE65_9PSEU
MTDNDHALAARLAASAGRHLVELRERDDRGDPRALGAAGDQSAHKLLVAELTEHRPEDTVVSEHGTAGPPRRAGGRTWIVDPLDGTREFGEPGRQDWAVHVALAEGEDLIAGAVALPARDVVLSTAEAPLSVGSGRNRPRIAVSRTRPPRFVEPLAEALGAVPVPLGSAGAKIAAVVLGDVDAYVHAGGQYEWDSAAPVAVARAAGMHASRLDGSPLRYNQPDPWLPDLVVCRPGLAESLLAELAELDLTEEGL